MLTIPDERQAAELARAEAEEASWRGEVREARLVGAVMFLLLVLELMCFALSMHLTGVWAWRMYYLGALLSAGPMVVLVAWRVRKDW